MLMDAQLSSTAVPCRAVPCRAVPLVSLSLRASLLFLFFALLLCDWIAVVLSRLRACYYNGRVKRPVWSSVASPAWTSSC